MVDRESAGQNHRRVLCQVNFLLTELLSVHAFHVNERTEVDGEFLPVSQVEIGRLFGGRLGLGDQDGFDLLGHGCCDSMSSKELAQTPENPKQGPPPFEGAKIQDSNNPL